MQRILATLLLLLAPALAFAQEAPDALVKRTTDETRTSPSGTGVKPSSRSTWAISICGW